MKLKHRAGIRCYICHSWMMDVATCWLAVDTALAGAHQLETSSTRRVYIGTETVLAKQNAKIEHWMTLKQKIYTAQQKKLCEDQTVGKGCCFIDDCLLSVLFSHSLAYLVPSSNIICKENLMRMLLLFCDQQACMFEHVKNCRTSTKPD